MSKYLVTADVDWIDGHLRFGHFEGELTEEQYQKYLALSSEEEREKFISRNCNLIVDDWEIDDYDSPSNINIQKL